MYGRRALSQKRGKGAIRLCPGLWRYQNDIAQSLWVMSPESGVLSLVVRQG